MELQKVTIVTRTANRPKGFKKLRESIEAQTYSNIHHIVIIDDINTLDYLDQYRDKIDLLIVDKEEILSEPRGINPNTGPYFPYNLYINKAYPHIKEGFFYGIDDDDYLLDDNVISDLVEAGGEDILVLGRFQLNNGTIIPLDKHFGKKPQICRIGGSCMFFHSKWLHFAKFDCYKCSDFRVINRLFHQVPEVKYLDRVLMRCGNNGGLGKKKDI